MEKALEFMKEYRERILDVTIEQSGEIAETGIALLEDFDEAIAELEAQEAKSCDGCVYGVFGVDSFGLDIECTIAYRCSRGQDDMFKPKDNK